MTGKPKIELRGVKKRFGPKVVLDGIDLVVNEGDSVVIIGGSGSGKSVTIKCVLGIIQADAGTILVDGEDVTHINGSKREAQLKKFGMLFQGGALFDSLPVWENVAFGLIQGRGVSRKEAREIAIEKLAKVGLGGEVANLSPAELSGGMQKRVGLARAIAADPEIIFFDEPTTGLDHARHGERAEDLEPHRHALQGQDHLGRRDQGHRSFRQSLRRSIHPRFRGRPHQDGGPPLSDLDLPQSSSITA